MDFCIYDSRLTDFKEPFGAVPAGTAVRFCVHLPKELCPRLVEFVLCSDGEADRFFAMELDGCTLRYNCYRFTFTPPRPKLYFYYFQVTVENGVCHLIQANQQMLGELGLHSDRYWQLTVYDPQARRPAAFGSGILYQIFPDRFCNSGEKKQDVPTDRILRSDWGNLPVYLPDKNGEITNSDYFGGDLKGITQHLDYLQALGVTCLYLNPIFEAHSNHRYNTADYLNVDPLLGTNEEFEVLCREAAKYGIGIVLDGVFSHTGSDSRYFNREGRYGDGGAYRDPNSPYRSWYDFDPKYKGGYRSWWGFETLPEVNEENPSYVEFITGEGGVIDTWLRRGAAGFRLDVADELPDDFIEKIRAAVKRVSPEKFLLGEVWEDATTKYGFGQRRTYLLGKGLDSVMNYPFKNAVLDFVKGKPAEQAMGEILSICEHYPAPAMDTALNFLSTHDTERALTVIADEPANGRGREWQSGRCVAGEAYEEGMLRLRMAYAIIYTLPGVPCLYYGDEIGMQGYRDPFNRAFFCWDSHEKRLKPVLAQLAQLRHSCEAFRTGELRVLRAEDGILHYQRIGKTETAEIIVNRSEHIIVEPLASGKHTEVNPMGFTIVVEENGHNPNHSYYDIQ